MIKQISTEEAIKRVLMTPLGSRVMRPNFGSRLFELIDKTFNSDFILDAIHYTYEAIETNLKEIKIKNVNVDKNYITILCEDKDGELEVEVEFK